MLMSQDKYTDYALENLKERGITSPSTELLRLELIHQHLDEAACLASLINQRELERAIASVLLKVRDQRHIVERCSVIAG